MLAEIFQFLYVYLLYPFIAVHHENPFIGSLSQRKIPGSAEVVYPKEIIDLIGVFGCQLFGAVCGTCIYDNDFKVIRKEGR